MPPDLNGTEGDPVRSGGNSSLCRISAVMTATVP